MFKKGIKILEPGQNPMAHCPSRARSLLDELKQPFNVIGSKYHEDFLIYRIVAAVAGASQAMVLFAFAEYPLGPCPASSHIPLGPGPLHPLGEELFIGLILGDKELSPLRGRAFLFSGAARASAGYRLVNPLPRCLVAPLKVSLFPWGQV